MPHTFGPENATLTVRTKRTGAASKAGHDLLIEVTAWSATLDDDAKAGIAQTIDEEVLAGTPIEFRSTSLEGGTVEGELELAGERRPISFELAEGEEGRFTGRATVKQSDW